VSLIVEGLHLRYGEKIAVHEVSFRVEPGQVLGLLGPNGAGKSTTLKAVVGLKRPTRGAITLAGIDAVNDPVRARRKLGYLPELPALYEALTPREHLLLFARLHGIADAVALQRIETLLELLKIRDVLDAPIATFSKGMRQKVLISAALLHDPEVVILDEPLSGLDAETAGLLKALLQEMKRRGKAVVYTSHILDVVERVADSMVVLHQGRVVAAGDLAALRARAGSDADLDQVFRILTAAEDPLARARALLDAVARGAD
jgi:ABC-2 type transport system ATP-binding protein